MSEPLGKMSSAPSVLVVDDEPLIAMLVADWLGELGCRVVGPAGNVADAFALIEAETLDGVLLDVTLGSGDSFALADRAGVKGLRIAFITGRNAMDLPVRFKGALVLAKPFEFEAIRTLVAKLLDSTTPPSA
jgi:DNA-binding response OmpR family regulator